MPMTRSTQSATTGRCAWACPHLQCADSSGHARAPPLQLPSTCRRALELTAQAPAGTRASAAARSGVGIDYGCGHHDEAWVLHRLGKRIQCIPRSTRNRTGSYPSGPARRERAVGGGAPSLTWRGAHERYLVVEKGATAIAQPTASRSAALCAETPVACPST